jgi:DNA-binding MarR family transcriptional regulator
MDKSAPITITTDSYMDIENRLIDEYVPRIGVHGFAVYLVIKRHLDHTPTHCPLSYATIARKLGMDQGAVIRHVKKLKRLHLLSPSLRFTEEGGS